MGLSLFTIIFLCKTTSISYLQHHFPGISLNGSSKQGPQKNFFFRVLHVSLVNTSSQFLHTQHSGCSILSFTVTHFSAGFLHLSQGFDSAWTLYWQGASVKSTRCCRLQGKVEVVNVQLVRRKINTKHHLDWFIVSTHSL